MDSIPKVIGDRYDMKRISFPMYFQGGNIAINDQGHCLTTKHAFEENKVKHRRFDSVLTEDGVREILQRGLGCTKVIVLDTMPNEKTGHVDIFAKWLPGNKVLVSKLDLEEMPKRSFSGFENADFISKQAKFLDSVAEQLAADYEVIRLPTIAPYLGVTYSYANSLFLGNRVIFPSYVQESLDEDIKSYFEEVEQKAIRVYAEYGFEAIAVLANKLADRNGAIHCVTMQVPADFLQ